MQITDDWVAWCVRRSCAREDARLALDGMRLLREAWPVAPGCIAEAARRAIKKQMWF